MLNISFFFSPLTEVQALDFHHCYDCFEFHFPFIPPANQTVYPNSQPHKLIVRAPSALTCPRHSAGHIQDKLTSSVLKKDLEKSISKASSHGTCFKAEVLPPEPDTCKSMEPDRVQLKVQWELADVVVMPLLMVFEKLW